MANSLSLPIEIHINAEKKTISLTLPLDGFMVANKKSWRVLQEDLKKDLIDRGFVIMEKK